MQVDALKILGAKSSSSSSSSSGRKRHLNGNYTIFGADEEIGSTNEMLRQCAVDKQAHKDNIALHLSFFCSADVATCGVRAVFGGVHLLSLKHAHAERRA